MIAEAQQVWLEVEGRAASADKGEGEGPNEQQSRAATQDRMEMISRKRLLTVVLITLVLTALKSRQFLEAA